MLGGAVITRILSSPYLRCLETVEPLAQARGLAVEPTEDLAEGAGLERLFQLLRRLDASEVVLCAHADVVQELLDHLIARGIVEASKARLAKASTWVLETKAGRITAARYISAP